MRLVCPDCFEEEGLKRRIIEIRPEVGEGRCALHYRNKGVPISAVAEIVDQVFRDSHAIGNYNRFAEEQDGDPLDLCIYELTRPESDDIAEALVEQLIENQHYDYDDVDGAFYALDNNYVRHEIQDYYHSTLWTNFCTSILHSQRFFNSEAKDLIDEIFRDVHLQRDNNKRSPIYEIKPDDPKSIFYRARIAPSRSDHLKFVKDPEKELSPPPERKRRPGRMNSAGISTFYGSYDLATCIAELRPVVGSTVVGAKFRLIRPIRVLDTTMFEAPISERSPFSKEYLKLLQQWRFMQQFRYTISRPVSPDDEYLDYIPTQAVAEYLLRHFRSGEGDAGEPVEGVIYKSAQNSGGVNIALLGDAAHLRATNIELKENQRSVFGRVLPDSMAAFWDEDRPDNPAIELISKSVTPVAVTSVEYKFVDFSMHDDDDVDDL